MKKVQDKKQPKKRADKYEEKLKINTSFADAIKVLVKNKKEK